MFSYHTECDDQLFIIRLIGELDMEATMTLAISDPPPGCPRVLFNLEEVDFVDSTGLGHLICLWMRFQAAGFEIDVRLNEAISDIFDVSGALQTIK